VIIDSHVHVLPPAFRERRDQMAAADPWFAACHGDRRPIATAVELIAAMDAAGVDRAVCFTWPFRDQALCVECNDHMVAVQRESPDRIIGFAIVNPASPDAAAELRRCARLGLRGVGEVNCDAQGFALDDAAIAGAVEASVELQMPWTLHCSEPVGHDYPGKGSTTPDQVARFAERHPSLRLIGAHLGGGLPLYAHMPEVEQLCRRMWFDTAAGPFLYQPSVYRAVVDLCGPSQLLFGSDFPLLKMDRYVSAFDEAGLTDSERRQLMGDAAATLLQI